MEKDERIQLKTEINEDYQKVLNDEDKLREIVKDGKLASDAVIASGEEKIIVELDGNSIEMVASPQRLNEKDLSFVRSPIHGGNEILNRIF